MVKIDIARNSYNSFFTFSKQIQLIRQQGIDHVKKKLTNHLCIEESYEANQIAGYKSNDQTHNQ